MNKKFPLGFKNIDYNLKNQFAHDIGRYDFLYDISRIEKVKNLERMGEKSSKNLQAAIEKSKKNDELKEKKNNKTDLSLVYAFRVNDNTGFDYSDVDKFKYFAKNGVLC